MLTNKQIKEIREHLEKAQNPVFFFDNDPDGLCSFLILRRYIDRGKGVPIRSFPELNESYFRKVQELNADYIFVLDKPIISKEFLDEVEKNNIPLVWIDHHEIQIEIPEFVYYYNPILNKEEKGNEPVTYLCYQTTKKKDDLWLAVAGCISDSYFPDFYTEFIEKYPELSIEAKKAFDILYKSEIGKITRIFDFSLKDRTTNVISMLKFLVQIKTPYEVLEENSKNHTMHYRFNQIETKYRKLLNKAEESVKDEKLLFFQYGGDLSISAELANELSYKFPKKIVVVAYLMGAKANISVRGKSVRGKIMKAIEGLESATAGGHEDAVGARVNVEDLDNFRERLKEMID